MTENFIIDNAIEIYGCRKTFKLKSFYRDDKRYKW